jgi:2-C-methyl-D-erythritol 4-phosphate cytidylyltransferase/2-C-methyl-D-erythritol 2,4-cyclodiphosphate synthase
MFDCILLIAGKGERANLGYNKLFYKINGRYIFEYALASFLEISACAKVILVCNEKDLHLVEGIFVNERIKITTGGKTRFESVKRGLEQASSEIVLIHDGARPLITQLDILRVYEDTKHNRVSYLAAAINDTIRTKNGITKDRQSYLLSLTPQGLWRKDYYELVKDDQQEYVDDVAAIETRLDRYGVDKISYQITEELNLKVTTAADIKLIEKIMQNQDSRIGSTIDVHKFCKGDHVVLGGVNIPYDRAIVAHSDGDCLFHAIAEALIGAMAKGDLGSHYSDTSERYKDIKSQYFLVDAKKLLVEEGYFIKNIDTLVMFEKLLLANYRDEMIDNIAEALELPRSLISVKYTRGEKIGIVGENEGIVAMATVLLGRRE